MGDTGDNTLMFTSDALALARQRGLDLVEVAPNEVPPVCKLMDYGKFRYEQTKKDRDSRKSQKQIVIKEVRFSPKIDDHDVEYRTKMVRRFLDEGNKVKLTVKFKGRELAHPNIGKDLLEQMRIALGDSLIVEAPPKMEGKNMTMLVSSKPPKPVHAPRPPQISSAVAAPQPSANGAAVVAEPPTALDIAAPAPAPAPLAEAVGVASGEK